MTAVRVSLVSLAAAVLTTGCAAPASPPAERDSYVVDPSAKPDDPFGYDGRKWRRGLGG